MTDLSDRQHDAFDNPAKAAVAGPGISASLREAAYSPRGRLVINQRVQFDTEANPRQARV